MLLLFPLSSLTFRCHTAVNLTLVHLLALGTNVVIVGWGRGDGGSVENREEKDGTYTRSGACLGEGRGLIEAATRAVTTSVVKPSVSGDAW